jgi:phospholipid transport system substrate-binding protein
MMIYNVTMKRVNAVFVLMLMLVAGNAYAQNEPMPNELVRKTTEEIIRLIKANRTAYSQDVTKLYAMVEQKVLPHFDFERMSQWILGRYWRQANEGQRARFIKEFRELLVRTYATALLNYTDQEVVYAPFSGKPEDEEAVVKTEIKQAGGGLNIPIQYAFYHKKSDGWKVYDLVIDGVSLVVNYRATYAGKLKQEGIDAVVASIAAKNKQMGNKPPPPALKLQSQP